MFVRWQRRGRIRTGKAALRRLREGVFQTVPIVCVTDDPFVARKVAAVIHGTSVAMIEKHYGHVRPELAADELTRE